MNVLSKCHGNLAKLFVLRYLAGTELYNIVYSWETPAVQTKHTQHIVDQTYLS